MGWDGPAGYVDPREAAAAAEAARRAEAERRIEDARTQTMADAVRTGFGDLAAAIVAAAGPDAITAWQQLQHDPRFTSLLPADCSLGDHDPDEINEANAQIDRDIDDLIDETDK